MHNALTDLIFFNNRWFLCFRESDAHVYGKNGVIRIISSQDGDLWTSVSLIKEEGIDLRDPKLSINPEGRLMLLMGGTVYQDKNRYITRRPRVAFSLDGSSWTTNIPILSEHEWLWRLTWNNDTAFGVSYRPVNPSNPRSKNIMSLFSTKNGIVYTKITEWNVPGISSETTIRFLKDGTMVALMRRDRWPDDHAWIGKSIPPYTDWEWSECNQHLGGPNFIVLPNDEMLASGRLVVRCPYGFFEKTAILKMSFKHLKTCKYLPSGGIDCSYPGMVYRNGIVWLSYYSSHEGKTAVYLSKIRI